MSDVPSDLFREILLRLPAEDLLRFRAVCKAWCHTIDDPTFIKSHAINQKSYSCTQLVMTDSRFRRFYCLSLNSLDIDDEVGLSLTRIKNSVHDIPPPRDLPTTTCHGLILISRSNRKWVIWNPLTGILLHFPRPYFASKTQVAGVGLGYDYATDDYKVVCLVDGKSVSESHVYSLKCRSWKPLKECPCDFNLRRRWGVYMKGALHWISASENVIIALDLGTEEYRLLPFPPLSSMESHVLVLHMDVLDGCLSLSHHYYYTRRETERGERFEMWMMEDETTWIKLLSFEFDDLEGLRAVAYSKSKGQVFLQSGNRFYLFDIHKHSVRKITIVGLPDSFSSQSFCGSLIRLHEDDDGAGSNAARLRRLNGKKMKIPTTAYSMRADTLFHLHSS